MQILHTILGALVLFFGRRLYWLAIGVLGFFVGVQLAGQLLADTQLVIQLLAAVAAGVIGALLAVVFQRVAFAIGGLFAGVYLAHGLAVSLGVDPEFQVIWLAIAGAVGAVIAALAMDWAIIVLTALVGARAIVDALDISDGISALLFVILTALGIAIQARQFSPPEPTSDRLV